MTADLAFGITAAERTDHARLGAELEQLGYREVWVNGVGVIALSEQPPARMLGVAIESGEPAAVGSALAPYRSVADTLVIRALPPSDAAEAWIGVARAVAHSGLSGDGRR